MTNLDLIKFRGEFAGLKVLVLNCLSEIAGQKSDPANYLQALLEHSVLGISQMEPSDIQKGHLRAFQESAAGIVAQAVEAVQKTHSRIAQPPTVQ